ncbi:MAG: N-acetylmuramoyl-L-alanine amidase [Bacteroidales bacterium]|nr:N-acetylmuramoyl-L-alanine amidase [Bacteroidales bacterium]
MNTLKKVITSFTFILFCTSSFAFTLVLDAGHGGQDAGAIGSFSKEKNINLTYVLALGEKIAANHKDVKIIYTRTTDVFIPLNERAQIANKANADLFMSIHTNSAKNKTANGTETFTLGHARSKENMELAMLENSVILLEEDYQKTYQGFDPNSTDSYIMFQFMQDQYMEQSIKFADLIQQNFSKNTPLTDRGVRQAGFLVLRATTMPSVLVELGFISNREEEKYLNRKENQDKMVDAIYEAFVNYKRVLEKKNGGQPIEHGKNTTIHTTPTPQQTTTSTPTQKPTNTSTVVTESNILFKVQFLVSKKKYKEGNAIFKGVTNIDSYVENGFYKYTTGSTSDIDAINQLKNDVAKKFPDAFVIAYKNGKRCNIHDAIKEVSDKK